MKKGVLMIGLLLAVLAVFPFAGESDADGPYDNQVSVTYMTGDKVYMTNIIDVGERVKWIPPVPEGYTGWDTDLSQPIYEDIVVNAIPHDKGILQVTVPIMSLVAIALAFISLAIVIQRY